MKAILPSLALILSVGFGSVSLAAPQSKQVAGLFVEMCLGQYGDYSSFRKILEDWGFELAPYGDWETATEFEFGHPESNIWGGFEIVSESPGCAFYHGDIADNEMADFAQKIVRDFTGIEPKSWAYNGGDASAWTAPYQGEILYVFFNSNGLAIDTRSE